MRPEWVTDAVRIGDYAQQALCTSLSVLPRANFTFGALTLDCFLLFGVVPNWFRTTVMLSYQAIALYAVGCMLAGASIGASWSAMRAPWLVNARGHRIGLGHYCVDDYCEEFPPRRLCARHQGFCGSWRSVTFLVTLSFVPEGLQLLALVFSWAFRHRKKTVIIVKYLAAAVAVFQTLGLILFYVAHDQLGNVLPGQWTLIGGYDMVIGSVVAQVLLVLLMLPFRGIVKGPSEPDDYDSDDDLDDDDIDTVSLDEEVPEEQRDFYLFNKQARRRALEDVYRSSSTSLARPRPGPSDESYHDDPSHEQAMTV